MSISRLRDLTFLLVIVSAPFLWLPLAELAGLSLKPVHLSLALVFLVVAIGSSRGVWNIQFSGDSFVFIALYSLYLIWYLVGLAWTNDLQAAIPGMGKNILYFVCFMVLAVMISQIARTPNFIRLAAISSLIGIFLYVIFMAGVFALNGFNLVGEYFSAIVTANVQRLQFWFYPTLFRFSAGSGSQLSTDVTTSLRNTILGGIIIETLLLVISYEVLKGRVLKVITFCGAALGVVLILLSVSRSNIVVLTISLVLPFAFRGWHYLRRHLRREVILALVLAPLLLLLGGYLLFRASSVLPGVRILQQRFAALASDPRLVMYNNALSSIEQNPFVGYGFGKKVPDSTGALLRVHNVFLTSWIETGIVGLILSLAWYSVLVVRLISAAFSSETWSLRVPKEWAAAFLVLPLFRVLETGGGTFTLMEWLALALYWGMWIAARRSRPVARESILSPVSPAVEG